MNGGVKQMMSVFTCLASGKGYRTSTEGGKVEYNRVQLTPIIKRVPEYSARDMNDLLFKSKLLARGGEVESSGYVDFNIDDVRHVAEIDHYSIGPAYPTANAVEGQEIFSLTFEKESDPMDLLAFFYCYNVRGAINTFLSAEINYLSKKYTKCDIFLVSFDKVKVNNPVRLLETELPNIKITYMRVDDLYLNPSAHVMAPEVTLIRDPAAEGIPMDKRPPREYDISPLPRFLGLSPGDHIMNTSYAGGDRFHHFSKIVPKVK